MSQNVTQFETFYWGILFFINKLITDLF